MKQVVPALYVGHVAHKRLRPTTHSLRYGVFTMLVDLDRIGDDARRLRLFSYNRFNLFSVWDRDHGIGTDRPLNESIRELLASRGIDLDGGRVWMLCYPRMLGYAFNPLTVFFCAASSGDLRAIVYEVSNTFGERHSYVLPLDEGERGEVLFQSCAKALYVSPFNQQHGRYTFHVLPPHQRVSVAVLLRDEDGPLLKAHFAGDRLALSDRTLLQMAVRFPVMTMKVIAAIHWEALRLWWKGLPIVRRPRGPPSTVGQPGSTKDVSA